MESYCSEFEWDGRKYMVVTAHRLSQPERRRIFRDTERRYRTIFNAAAIGITQCTVDGRVVETNSALERMLGYSRQELRGMHFKSFTHPEDYALDLELFQEMVAGKRENYQIELRFLRKDQSYGWCRLNVSLVRDPGCEPAFVIGMVEDITDQKRAEQQLRESQKMEAVGRLVGGVAHDFNNLLTAVTLYSDLIASTLKPGSPLQRHVNEIRLASEQGGALIQQLLAIVRQQAVEPQVLSVNEVITSMQDMLARLIGENVELVTDLAPDLRSVKIDPTQLQQVILNLVLNARDAIVGNGHISLQTRNCDNNCSLNSCGNELAMANCVLLEVTDTGTGMDANTFSHLFEPFFTTKTPGQGNGLGLAMVHGIVKQAGGTIQVKSEIGQGTRVSLRLPLAQEGVLQLPAASRRPAAKPGHETILLVEDDAAVRRSIHRILAAFGYQVLEAANGNEALRVSSGHIGAVDLLLTDLVMPGLNGREVARQVREQRPNLPVLFISGYDRGHLPDGTKEEAGLIVFRKPFTGSALASKVREVLDSASGQSLIRRQKKR
jgi:two-component system, cell cycle sensor histidine kinase and response regulator CckA